MPRAELHEFGRGWGLLHVPALGALVIAQPLLDVLARGATFFVAYRLSFGEIALVVVALLALPLPLALVEALVGRFSLRGAAAVRLVSLAVLASVLASLALNRALASADRLTLPLALASGVGFAWAYWRWTTVRQFTGLLALALVAVPALFLASPQIRGLASAVESERAVEGTPLGTRAPVVMVVFDELPVTALMGADRTIDARRFPNFAALARRSTWFRNAVAASDTTEYALPALLSGRLPQPDELAVPTHFPDNLFTAFGRDYRIYAYEALSRLCPPELNAFGAERPTVRARWGSLASDLAVVYGHIVLPEPLRTRLPGISSAWQGFGRSAPRAGVEEGSGTPSAPAGGLESSARRSLADDRVAVFRSFVAAIERRSEPSLYFLHILLPHVPWQYTPSGRLYSVPGQRIPGLYDERWVDDAELVRQGFERFLRQLQFLDTLLGELLARLESEGLLDEAALVVTADHGVSFRPGDCRRNLTPTNRHDILPVPFFVKAPGQSSGRIADEPVSALATLPTLFDILKAEPPWEMAVPSALAPPPPGPRRVLVKANGLVEVAAGLDDEKWRTLEEKLRLFGSAAPSFEYGGPRAELVDTEVERLPRDPERRVEGMILDGSGLFENVDPGGPSLPVYVSGTLGEGEPSADLAIAVNGTIRATTRSYRPRGSGPRFGALIAERHLRAGDNRIEVFAVSGAGAAARLQRLTPPDARGDRLEILDPPAVAAIVGSGGRTPVRPGALEGLASVTSDGELVRVTGWAWDRDSDRPPAGIALFLRGESIFTGTTTDTVDSSDAFSSTGSKARADFRFELPADLVPGLQKSGLRVLASSRAGVASELSYAYQLGPSARNAGASRAAAADAAWEIRVSDGRVLEVVPGALAGRFERSARTPDGPVGFELSGWAADLDAGRPADELLVFSGGSLLLRGTVRAPSPEVAPLRGRPGLERAGFRLSASASAARLEDLRVFATSERGIASELEGETGIETELVLGPGGAPTSIRRNGVETALRPGAVRGFIGAPKESGGFVWLTGWALDVDHAAEPRVVLAFVRGRLVAAGRPTGVREDVNRSYGLPSPGPRSAFELPVPRSELGEATPDQIHLVAVSNAGEASLLGAFLYLEPDARGRPVLKWSDGRRYPSRPEAVAGFVESRELDEAGLRLEGWAVDRSEPRSPLSLLIFSGPMPVARITPGLARPDLAAKPGLAGAAGPGFRFLVPRDALPARLQDVRVFAITSAEEAAELHDLPRP